MSQTSNHGFIFVGLSVMSDGTPTTSGNSRPPKTYISPQTVAKLCSKSFFFGRGNELQIYHGPTSMGDGRQGMEKGDEKGGEGNPPKMSRINTVLDPPLACYCCCSCCCHCYCLWHRNRAGLLLADNARTPTRLLRFAVADLLYSKLYNKSE